MEPLAANFAALGGDGGAQLVKPLRRLSNDFYDSPSGTFVEVDEVQHFTSHRLRTLDFYPADTPLGYDPDYYRELCRRHAPRADREYAH